MASKTMVSCKATLHKDVHGNKMSCSERKYVDKNGYCRGHSYLIKKKLPEVKSNNKNNVEKKKRTVLGIVNRTKKSPCKKEIVRAITRKINIVDKNKPISNDVEMIQPRRVIIDEIKVISKDEIKVVPKDEIKVVPKDDHMYVFKDVHPAVFKIGSKDEHTVILKDVHPAVLKIVPKGEQPDVSKDDDVKVILSVPKNDVKVDIILNKDEKQKNIQKDDKKKKQLGKSPYDIPSFSSLYKNKQHIHKLKLNKDDRYVNLYPKMDIPFAEWNKLEWDSDSKSIFNKLNFEKMEKKFGGPYTKNLLYSMMQNDLMTCKFYSIMAVPDIKDYLEIS
ncbi:MAG: hypothetical protein Edafosvirus23_6 [Edafosvirus sp.]|uniref:Uncharacterized protein n=1 Tax=Edafosvirus sp. TaxID=2487765 RepID=A0A3G4ZUU0_9VIRU|nr:MAG: hypothetical protein Edafosvirus23_6 [Edafosvirus sp.]